MTLVGAIVLLALVGQVGGNCLKSQYPDYFEAATYPIESVREFVEQYPDSATAIVESALGLTPPICLARVETYGDGGSVGLILVDSGEREVRMTWVNSARIVGRPCAPSYIDWKGRLLVGSTEERAALVALWLCAGAVDSDRVAAAEVAERIEVQRNSCAETVRIHDPSREASGNR